MNSGEFTPRNVQNDRPGILFVGDHGCFSEIYLRLISEEFGHFRIVCDRRIADAERRVQVEGDSIAFIVVCCRFGMPALASLRRIVDETPSIHPVLAYATMNEVRGVLRSVEDYAPFERLSFLPMLAKVDAVISILHLLISGECHVSNEVVKMLLENQEAHSDDLAAHPSRFPASCQADLDVLTTREMEVLSLLSEGAPNKTIAEELALSQSTVKLHIHHIIAKLGVRNRTEAAVSYLGSRLAPQCDPLA